MGLFYLFFMTVNMRIASFCFVMACSLVDRYRVSEENVFSIFRLEVKVSYPNLLLSLGLKNRLLS
jgi:hypothetical protein